MPDCDAPSAIALTDADRREMFGRALKVCPDIDDDEAVMRHLYWLRLDVSSIGATEVDAMLDEARAARRSGPFIFN